jgi:hypothetical protein
LPLFPIGNKSESAKKLPRLEGAILRFSVDP